MPYGIVSFAHYSVLTGQKAITRNRLFAGKNKSSIISIFVNFYNNSKQFFKKSKNYEMFPEFEDLELKLIKN